MNDYFPIIKMRQIRKKRNQKFKDYAFGIGVIVLFIIMLALAPDLPAPK